MTENTKVNEDTDANEAQIAVHWKEEEYFKPSEAFVRQANMHDPDVRKRFAEDNFPDCFREYADMLTWSTPYTSVLDTSHPPFWKWFVGGKLNACYNCVDRHLAEHRNKAALTFVGEPEEDAPVVLTYQELYVRVNEMAALLRDYCGLKAGDRVTLHLPMTLDLPITMLACARLGIIHSQVFGGFSGQSCGSRIAGLRQPLSDHHRCLLAVRQIDRSQANGRYRGGDRGEGRPARRQGPDLAALPRQVQRADADGRGARRVRQRILKKYVGQRIDPVPMDRRRRCS